ncbi:hypothetical protein GPECTOR_1g282 [Gonium pectorale]|uniref:Peptidase M11 gametolysin domain-containing protein n=1 Tax=Gonium pectorale TaxID=33097 RepID=A0A150H440_GONPE|nr:hypothetical protein GPECTOR_1g282 [Gonium pectorale]|eukprot:KXZ56320.1 hypothetical protein GPECTOR_1g282 [Gonium pectorale]
MFFGPGNSAGQTMKEYYRTCSYGQVEPDPDNFVVTTIDICSGTLDIPFRFPSGNAFDVKSCDNDNMVKWQYYMDSQVQRGADAPFKYYLKNGQVTLLNDTVNPMMYNHKIMVLPKNFNAITSRERC